MRRPSRHFCNREMDKAVDCQDERNAKIAIRAPLVNFVEELQESEQNALEAAMFNHIANDEKVEAEAGTFN